jgi:hypothetical protein
MELHGIRGGQVIIEWQFAGRRLMTTTSSIQNTKEQALAARNPLIPETCG